MESIFLILSGVILAAGILYWFWSHIQLTQKKVQLLENAVFELRGMRVPAPAPAPVQSQVSSSPVPSSLYNDLTDDGWDDDTKDVPAVSTPLEEINDDLQPGGRIDVPTEMELIAEEKNADQFRELFIGQDNGETGSPLPLPLPLHQPVTGAARTPESLDSMPVKELRRLAEQRGILGVSEMRKKEILAALRQQVSVVETVPESTESVEPIIENEGTLDLVESMDIHTLE